MLARLSSVAEAVERFLGTTGFDRAPWLAVAFAAGIAAWFILPQNPQWIGLVAALLGLALAAMAMFAREGRFAHLRQAMIWLALAGAAGCGTVWAKSLLVGVPGIERPMVTTLDGMVLSRDERPAEERVRLVVETRNPETGRVMRVRLNLPLTQDDPAIGEGARLRIKARLMPPAPPMLPGGYDFARTAWFSGLAATGSVLGKVEVLEPARGGGVLGAARATLSRHVRERVDGSAGAIAATLASGDRGAIPADVDQAMRDAGLAHLLSISGLHVSAVVAAAYFLAIRLLALWPWLALRVRLPVLAAGAGALAGIGYTLLTGSQVPTVRSCVGAILVLMALVLGREPLSLRMLAVAAFFVMLAWPEAVVGPSFQMSFSAVIAIIALHGCAPVRHFLAPRDERRVTRWLRGAAMLLLTGLVIELALMPIGLYHFHRGGVYGALANVVAIPLTTFVAMPSVVLGLMLDTIGAGAPAWWIAEKSIGTMLALAHFVSSRPGAVTMLPAMGLGPVLLVAFGGLWLALWRGQVRLIGLVPAAIGAFALATVRPPDVLLSADGRHVGIVGEGGALMVLREMRSSYARDNLTEMAGTDGDPQLVDNMPGTRCSREFCTIALERGGRAWRLLIARGRDMVPERALAAACERVDIVIADRGLPHSCQPAWLKADRRLLSRTGGLTIDLKRGKVRSVSEEQGDHGW